MQTSMTEANGRPLSKVSEEEKAASLEYCRPKPLLTYTVCCYHSSKPDGTEYIEPAVTPPPEKPYHRKVRLHLVKIINSNVIYASKWRWEILIPVRGKSDFSSN